MIQYKLKRNIICVDCGLVEFRRDAIMFRLTLYYNIIKLQAIT